MATTTTKTVRFSDETTKSSRPVVATFVATSVATNMATSVATTNDVRLNVKSSNVDAPGGIPFTGDNKSIFYRVDRLYWLTLVALVFNAGFVFACILLYFHGTLDSTDVQKSAADDFAILGTIDAVFSILLLCKNTVLQNRILDASFHQNTKYHIYFALMALANWIIHGALMMGLKLIQFDSQFVGNHNLTAGLAAWCALFVMPWLSLEPFRRVTYLGFYVVHWFFTLWITIMGSFHSPTVFCPIMVFCIVLYVADFVYYRYRAAKKTATITRMKLLPGNMVRVDFQKPDLEYKAGQHVRICFPDDIGPLQWHPFSLASAPYQGGTTSVVIRNVGSFTGDVWDIAKQWHKQDKALTSNKANKRIQKSLYVPRMFVEGPYGQLTLKSHKLYDYKHVLFICGGSGVTPLQSLFNDYLHYQSTVPQVPQVHTVDFIWAVREDQNVCTRLATEKCNLQQIRYGHFQPNLLDHRAVFDVKKRQPAANINVKLYLSRTETVRLKSFKRDLPQVPNAAYPVKQDYIQLENHGVNIERVVNEAASRVDEAHDNYLAVLVCGPPTMVEETKEAVRKYSSLIANIDLHVESFLP